MIHATYFSKLALAVYPEHLALALDLDALDVEPCALPRNGRPPGALARGRGTPLVASMEPRPNWILPSVPIEISRSQHGEDRLPIRWLLFHQIP